MTRSLMCPLYFRNCIVTKPIKYPEISNTLPPIINKLRNVRINSQFEVLHRVLIVCNLVRLWKKLKNKVVPLDVIKVYGGV